jgi:hypothetical protein
MIIFTEVIEFKTKIINKFTPQKTSSIDATSPSKKKWSPPNQKESTIEIKNIENKPLMNTEKEDLIKKIDTFKKIRLLFILRNDLDVLPLPDQPLKRYSSHYSQGELIHF